jgi:hypothetical protein
MTYCFWQVDRQFVFWGVCAFDVLLHRYGRGVGSRRTSRKTDIMLPTYSTTIVSLSALGIRAITATYLEVSSTCPWPDVRLPAQQTVASDRSFGLRGPCRSVML